MNKTELEQAKTCGKSSLEHVERHSPESAEGRTTGEMPEGWDTATSRDVTAVNDVAIDEKHRIQKTIRNIL